mgnify:CR=1 FL=1
MDSFVQQQNPDSQSKSDLNRTLLYEEILHSDLFVVYRNAFEQVTGHALALIHPDVRETPKGEYDRSKNKYCSTLLSLDLCKDQCIDHTERVAGRASLNAHTAKCPGNVTTTLIPVKAGKNIVCYLRTGQVRFNTTLYPKRFLEKLNSSLPESVAEDLDRAYREMPTLDKEKYYDQLVILGAFSLQLSTLASQMLNKEEPENLLIQRCKRYIGEQLTEKICLDSLASHTNVTNSYLCKQFKKHTGLTIVEYINRHRIELAKNILTDSDKKVIDVAYACGFQSLSQFNRTFSKFTHLSPSKYRSQN